MANADLLEVAGDVGPQDLQLEDAQRGAVGGRPRRHVGDLQLVAALGEVDARDGGRDVAQGGERIPLLAASGKKEDDEGEGEPGTPSRAAVAHREGVPKG
jgi:hypothetical protein